MNASFPLSLNSFKPKTDIGRGLGVSFAAHGAIIAALAIAAWWNFVPDIEEPEDPPLITFDLPGPSDTDGEVVPEIAPPKALQDSEPTLEPVPPESSASGSGSASGTAFVWTPDPPTSVIGQIGSTLGFETSRIFLENLEIPEGASDPILLSFEEAKLNSVAEMEEAARLSGSGSMRMSVQVDIEGKPVLCNISQTSGSKILDERGCELIMSYRYRPAHGFTGEPRPALIFEWLEWMKTGSNDEDSNLVIPGTGSGARPVSEGENRMPRGAEIVDVDDF